MTLCTFLQPLSCCYSSHTGITLTIRVAMATISSTSVTWATLHSSTWSISLRSASGSLWRVSFGPTVIWHQRSYPSETHWSFIRLTCWYHFQSMPFPWYWLCICDGRLFRFSLSYHWKSRDSRHSLTCRHGHFSGITSSWYHSPSISAILPSTVWWTLSSRTK